MRHIGAACLVFVFGLGACTSVPTPSASFLASNPNLSPAEGVRGQRLSAPTPTPPMAQDEVLVIGEALLEATASPSRALVGDEVALLKNALGRSLCRDFSPFFEIVDDPSGRAANRLAVNITKVTPTNPFSATVGAVTRRLAPVGVRPPFGLGAITIEFELLRPDGTRATAMVWSQNADIASSNARVSTIGDAYGLTERASSDFLGLVKNKSGADRAISRVGDTFGNRPDAACGKYGDAPNVVSRFLQLPPTLPNQPSKPQTP